MRNEAAPKKAGPAEHGDGAIVRCHHDSNSPVLSKLSHACCRGILPGDALLPATAGDGRLWRKPNPATLSTCGQELQPGFSFSVHSACAEVWRGSAARRGRSYWCTGSLAHIP